MRKLLKNKNADVKMVGAVVGILITLIVSILVFYNVANSVDVSSEMEQNVNSARGLDPNHDAWNNTTSIANSTTDILDQAATFYQIAPIIAIVVVAVVILGYVNKIGVA